MGEALNYQTNKMTSMEPISFVISDPGTDMIDTFLKVVTMTDRELMLKLNDRSSLNKAVQVTAILSVQPASSRE